MIFNVCTLISYYKKNKLFQFKKKKKYSLFNKINELMKSSTRTLTILYLSAKFHNI